LIAADDGVRSLTETPLLLSLLCIQFRHDLNLPKRRDELYSRCVSVLLKDWDSGRRFRRSTNYEELTDSRKLKLFEQVAAHYMLTGERFDLPVQETHSVVGEFIEKCGLEASQAESVVQEIESLHGIIERLSQDNYCFSHSTLQEYFAACRFIASRDEVRITQDRHLEEAWEPVIEFMSTLADDPKPIFEVLTKASNMSGLSNYPAMAKRTKVLSLLYKCLSSCPLLSKIERAKVIAQIIESHYQMATIYGAGGVYPFAALRRGGVVHTYVWTNKRPTLAEALKPFRRLSNLIYLNPMPEYVSAVFKCLDNNRWHDDLVVKFGASLGQMIQENLTVSLLVPIARSRPDETVIRLQGLVSSSVMPFFKKSVNETIEAIKSE